MFLNTLRKIINPCIINFYGSSKQVFNSFPSNTYYKIKLLTPSDVTTAWNLIKKTYLTEDPLCKLLNIANSNDIHVFQKYIQVAACEGISLKAITNDDNEDIMGVCINNKFCPWDLKVLNRYCARCEDENMKRVFKCYREIASSYNLFEKYHPRVLDMGILSVDSKHQGKGIGYGLIRCGLSFGRDLGYHLAKVECTSAYSAMICGRCKMKLVKTIPYGNFDLGTVPDPPHTDVKIYVYDFNKFNKSN